MNKKWEIQYKVASQKLKFKSEEILEILLKNRGIISKKEQAEFLHPDLAIVTPEAVGIKKQQLAKALKRIVTAVQNNEQIIIFGDYDVDGITATAILWETLNNLGAKVMPYIPHRMDEGYGLSAKGIDNVLAKHPDTSLIITVDNGIVANGPVDYANEKGIDVIVTDHHVPDAKESAKLPDAFAIVHTTALCGAGIAWVLSKEIRSVILTETNNQARSSTGAQDDEKTHLELAALGTIADLVPLTGANRSIVKFGLKELQQTNRPGLKALYHEAGITPSSVSTYEVGHMIGPRLNAMGRLEYAMDSLRLLCTKNLSQANQLATLLSKTNKERQDLTKVALEHARAGIRNQELGIKKLLFIAHESYQQGIIGLIAGRLVEEYYRPTIVLSTGETHSKASARSIKGFNIIQFIRTAEEYLTEAGGHPMAAGFTVENGKLALLQQALEELAEKSLTDDLFQRVLSIDMELPLVQIDEHLFGVLLRLAPFGMGNAEPVFVTKNVVVEDKRYMGKDHNHVKLQLYQDNSIVYDAVGFGMAENCSTIEIGDTVDIVYTISENVWNGRKSLQLKLKDIKQVSGN